MMATIDEIQAATDVAMADWNEVRAIAIGRGIDGERLLGALLMGLPKTCLGMPDPVSSLRHVRRQRTSSCVCRRT